MAHTKASGTTKNVRDSRPKYLGVKLNSGQFAKPGNIIVRQRGLKFLSGSGTKLGSDYTIYAFKEGKVQFKNKVKKNFHGDRRLVKEVTIE